MLLFSVNMAYVIEGCYALCTLCSYETVFVNLRRKPDWLFERNPLGLVPILEYKRNVIYESAVCDEFLEKNISWIDHRDTSSAAFLS